MPTRPTVTVELTTEQIQALKALFGNVITTDHQQLKKKERRKKLDYTAEIEEAFKRKYPFE